MAEKTIKDKLVTVAGIIPKVYEAGVEEGKIRERSEFWDALLQDGNRTSFRMLFHGYTWDFGTFYPTRDLIIKGDAFQLFYNWMQTSAQKGSLIVRLNECRVRLDTSQATDLTQMFSYTYISEIPTIDCSNAPGSTHIFANAWASLKKIEKVIVNPNTTYKSWFYNDTGLEEIRIEGTIGQNGFDIHFSTKLSRESIESIINALSDTTSGLTVTLSEAACKKAFNVPDDEDIFAGSGMFCDLVLSKSNWTIALI